MRLNSLRSVESWEKAKCMSECYDYLFEIAVKMKSIGIGERRQPTTSDEVCIEEIGANAQYAIHAFQLER